MCRQSEWLSSPYSYCLVNCDPLTNRQNSSGSKKKNNGLGDLAYLHIILSRQAFNGLIQ